MDDFASFARLLRALRPWMGRLVVIGGWVHLGEAVVSPVPAGETTR